VLALIDPEEFLSSNIRHFSDELASIDPGLNESRALLLRHYGFDVTTSESKGDGLLSNR